jgi:hypothetical protein
MAGASDMSLEPQFPHMQAGGRNKAKPEIVKLRLNNEKYPALCKRDCISYLSINVTKIPVRTTQKIKDLCCVMDSKGSVHGCLAV